MKREALTSFFSIFSHLKENHLSLTVQKLSTDNFNSKFKAGISTKYWKMYISDGFVFLVNHNFAEQNFQKLFIKNEKIKFNQKIKKWIQIFSTKGLRYSILNKKLIKSNYFDSVLT